MPPRAKLPVDAMKRFLNILSLAAAAAAAAYMLMDPTVYLGTLYLLPGRDWKTSYLVSQVKNPRNGWRTRRDAARAIRRQGPEAERRAFYDLLAADPPFDDFIPGILGDLGPEAGPLLLEGLKDERREVRDACALWLKTRTSYPR
jgi:hypothetical protein